FPGSLAIFENVRRGAVVPAATGCVTMMSTCADATFLRAPAIIPPTGKGRIEVQIQVPTDLCERCLYRIVDDINGRTQIRNLASHTIKMRDHAFMTGITLRHAGALER